MTTKAKEKQEQEKRPLNKYYRSTRHISWIEIIPKYITPREAAALSTEEKERLLKPFERPRFPLPDLPPLARIRLFRQDLLGAAGRIQYEFRTRISNRGQYLASYRYNSSGYNQGPFNREFHKRQVIKEYSASTNNGLQHESHQE